MTTVATSRDLLEAIGVGHFNATMLIQYMMIAPATTDPKSPSVILIVRAVQQTLYQMGATDVADSGRLDAATASALENVAGPDWERMSWGAVIRAVIDARNAGMRLDAPAMLSMPSDGYPVAVSGPLDFLPDLPGGLFTYAALGYFAYRYFTKDKRS